LRLETRDHADRGADLAYRNDEPRLTQRGEVCGFIVLTDGRQHPRFDTVTGCRRVRVISVHRVVPPKNVRRIGAAS
jgi:hypothetical protein